jgi:hypothetical protein
MVEPLEAFMLKADRCASTENPFPLRFVVQRPILRTRTGRPGAMADQWIASHFDAIGERSTIDIKEKFL